MITQAQSTEDQYIVFDMAGELYGVGIGSVEEINRWQTITAVPNVPPYVEGVINLRGRVTPVMNLRARFGMPTIEPDSRTRIIVVRSGNEQVGLVVDGVSEVLRIPPDATEPPSALVVSAESALVQSFAKLGGRLIILISLERILDQELQAVVPAVA